MNSKQSELFPAWPSSDGPAIVFSSDVNYAPYLAAALVSLAQTASSDILYDVIVLSSDLNANEQKKIGAALDGHKNISLRFFDVDELAAQVSGNFFVNAHITQAAYYRLFTPTIFRNYDKILYLDCDIIIMEDLEKLYNQDLKGQAAGVFPDFFAVRSLSRKKDAAWALQLDMKDTNNHFNSGVLLLNLARLRTENYEKIWFDRLRQVKTPRLHDQDILNHTLEGATVRLDAAWNSPAWMESIGSKIEPGDIPERLYAEYRAAIAAPKILHYLTHNKPWDLPHLPLAERFWECAAETPYYDRLIFNSLKRLSAENDLFKGRLSFPPLYLKYLFYILMGRLAGGERGARYRAKAFKVKKMNPPLKTILRSWHR